MKNTLMDERGCTVELKTEYKGNINICYIGADKPVRTVRTIEEDINTVSWVKDIEFCEDYKVTVRDPGISEDGLRVSIKKGSEDEVPDMSVDHTEDGYVRYVKKSKASGNKKKADEPVKIELWIGGEKADEIELTDSFEKVYSMDEIGLVEREYLEKVHGILYKLLHEIDRVCVENKLHYFLVFGGLLGYYRVGDIIPWDDDVDIAMPRRDFEKFKKIAPKALGKDFMFLDYSEIGDNTFLDFLSRVIYTGEEVPVNAFQKVHGKCRADIENHIPMDIFVLDNASDNKHIHTIHANLLRGVYGLCMAHRAKIDYSEYSIRDFKTRAAVRLLSVAGRLFPTKLLFWMHEKLSMIFIRRKTADYFMSNSYLPFMHTRYSKEWFRKGKRVKYGKVMAYAPNDVEAFLKRAYYDYTHYPPVEKRIPEHSPEHKGII